MKQGVRFSTLIRALIFVTFISVGCTAQRSRQGQRPDQQSRLEQYVHQVGDSSFAFSVLVAVDGKVILQKGYGWIDSTRTIRANDRTLFNIASITKSFTAVAVFLLRDTHLLQLEDALPKFFKDVPKDKRSITLTHLLTHTSGLAQNYVADGIVDRDSAIRRILNDTLRFAAGTSFSYSNENYELLGTIIEIVTGMSYESAMRRLVFHKSGMHDTKFWADTVDVGLQTIAGKNRKLDPAMLIRNWGYIASGGIYSNVTDLYHWFTALAGGMLLEPKHVEQMWTVQWRLSETGMAYGWFVSSSVRGREVWTRGTEDWGHNGVLRWFPDRNVVIIVLSNSGERGDKSVTANRFISDGIANIIFE